MLLSLLAQKHEKNVSYSTSLIRDERVQSKTNWYRNCTGATFQNQADEEVVNVIYIELFLHQDTYLVIDFLVRVQKVILTVFKLFLLNQIYQMTFQCIVRLVVLTKY